jgi:hypothetical protein
VLKLQLTVALVGGLLAGCGSVQPSPSPAPTITAATASIEPIPSPSPAAVTFAASIAMLEQCGSEGGCAFTIELVDPAGVVSSGHTLGSDALDPPLPALLGRGTYSLTFSSFLVSDIIVSGQPPAETPDASCAATFEVAGSEASITARGEFRADSCEVVVSID